jgi:tRNA(fMet)-specific endonuclease VapC
VILLDTDHVNALKYPGRPAFVTLTTRLEASDDQEVATTIITIEEQMRGWLAWLHRADDLQRQVLGYQELQRLFDFYSRWRVMPFDDRAAATFGALRQRRLRIGTMDLKIAAIALVHDALLLSANLRDFQRVPDLRVANGLHGDVEGSPPTSPG